MVCGQKKSLRRRGPYNMDSFRICSSIKRVVGDWSWLMTAHHLSLHSLALKYWTCKKMPVQHLWDQESRWVFFLTKFVLSPIVAVPNPMAWVAATAGSPIARTLRVHLVARHLLSSLHFDHSELASSTSSLGRRSCCAGHPAWLSTGRWWPPMLGWSTPAQAARTQTHTVAKPLCTLHKARTQTHTGAKPYGTLRIARSASRKQRSHAAHNCSY